MVVLPHQRADDEHLMPLGHLLADEGIQPLAVFLPHGEGVHPLPSGGQLVDDGHVQIAVDDERQRPGDGGGGQHQHMGGRGLFGQCRPLIHAEAVLLVGDDQPQPGVLHILGQQGVGADAQVDAAAGQTGQNLPALLGAGGAGEQGAAQPEAGEQRR